MSENVTTSAHLFAPPSHPKITSISRNAIQDFLAERAQYEVAIEAQPGLKPLSWAGCFDALFLRSLLRARIFGAHFKSIDEFSDDVIKSKLESLSSTTKHVSFDEAMGMLCDTSNLTHQNPTLDCASSCCKLPTSLFASGAAGILSKTRRRRQ